MSAYFILFFAMVLWGMYPILTHYFVLSLDPLFLVGITSLIGSFPFLLHLIFQKNIKGIFTRAHLRTLLPIAFFAAIGHMLLFVGTKFTSGANTGLLLQIEPIYSLILGVLFFKEVIESKRIGATALMILGAMVIVYKGGTSLNIGDICILLTTLMYQLSHAFAKQLLQKGNSSSYILAARQLYAGLMILILVFLTEKSLAPLINYQTIAIASFLGLYLSSVTFLWYKSIEHMPVSVASSFLPLTAFTSLLGSAFFLRETISKQQYIGFILIVGGLFWFAALHSKRRLKT